MSQSTLPRRASPWAIILIAIGVIWLLAEADIFNAANLSVLFRFWPLILIAFGVELLIARNNRQLSLLIIGGTVIVLLGLMLIGPSIGLAQSSADIKTETYTQPLDGVENARVNLSANVAEIRLSPVTDALFTADIEYVGDLSYDASTEGSTGVIALQSRGSVSMSNVFFLDWFGGNSLSDIQWNIGLNPEIPLDLNVSSGTGGIYLDLSDFQVSALTINTGTGGIELTLPAMDERYTTRVETGTGGGTITVLEGAAVRLDLNSGTGGMTVDVPDNAAVRVRGSVGTGGINVPGNFTRVSGGDGSFIGASGTWETEGYASAERQIEIEFDGGTGGLTVQ